MNNFVKQMVTKKLKEISSHELLSYSRQYQITLTKKQADNIAAYLKQNQLDPFRESDRLQMFKKLSQITDVETAKKTQKLFWVLIREYGIESWFK